MEWPLKLSDSQKKLRRPVHSLIKSELTARQQQEHFIMSTYHIVFQTCESHILSHTSHTCITWNHRECQLWRLNGSDRSLTDIRTIPYILLANSHLRWNNTCTHKNDRKYRREIKGNKCQSIFLNTFRLLASESKSCPLSLLLTLSGG